MKGGNALLVVIIGLLILWLGITGKFDCFGGTLNCMLSRPGDGQQPATTPPQTGAVTPPGVSNALTRVTARLGGSDWLSQPIGV